MAGTLTPAAREQKATLELYEAPGSSLDIRLVLERAYPSLLHLVPADFGALGISSSGRPEDYEWIVAKIPPAFFAAYPEMERPDPGWVGRHPAAAGFGAKTSTRYRVGSVPPPSRISSEDWLARRVGPLQLAEPGKPGCPLRSPALAILFEPRSTSAGWASLPEARAAKGYKAADDLDQSRIEPARELGRGRADGPGPRSRVLLETIERGEPAGVRAPRRRSRAARRRS